MHIWAIRCAALVILALVLWLAGPRAWVVLSAEFAPSTGSAAGPQIDLDQVGLRDAPSWLREDRCLQLSLFGDLAQLLRGGLALRDEARAATLCASLQAKAWVQSAELRRVPLEGGRGFQLDLELRRPVLWLEPIGYAKGEVEPCLVDAEGICMPLDLSAGPPALPRHEIDSGVQAGSFPVYVWGERHPRPEVLAAARVACEWRDEIQPAVPGLPVPTLIDARALDQRGRRDTILRGQVLLALPRRPDGECLVRYGYAPQVPFARVTPAQRIEVLRKVLARWPGFAGLQRIDLRFPERWEDQVREEPAPVGPGPEGR